MSAAEYIAGFFLVILGFAVSEILKGSARLLRERRRIKFFWPYLVVIPFLFEVLIFWFLWVFTVVNKETADGWSVVEILLISIQVVPWAFVSYLIFPSRIGDGFELKDFYFDNGKFVIGIVVFLNANVIVDMLRTGLHTGLLLMIVSLALNLVVLINFRKLHLIWLVINILLVNYFIFFEKPIVIH